MGPETRVQISLSTPLFLTSRGSIAMKTEAEIRAILTELETDERLRYPSATVDINAPLALVQLELEAKVNTLKWILDGGP